MEKAKDQMQDLDPKEKDQINHINKPADSPAEDISHPSSNWHIESGDKVNEY